jgi:ubiquinone/menaquinone biosynthesis C-methylase UbiE
VVSKYQRGGRLLDVGCSTGVFLNEMRRSGRWEVYGIEPAAFPARIAREHFRLQVFQKTLLEAKLPKDCFDVVTWWHVLEHTPNPKECLQETYRILKPGGWIFIQTPDPNSWEAKLFGPWWGACDAPRHLHLFPAPTLINQLNLLGFRVRSVKSFAGNLSTAFRSLGYWLDSQGLKVLGSFARILAYSVVCRVVTFPIASLLCYIGQAPSILYIAQKDPYG